MFKQAQALLERKYGNCGLELSQGSYWVL